MNVGTGEPQIIVGSTDGNVYVLWKEGINHAGGAIAKVWTCSQTDGVEVNSTPTICSLDGTYVNLIVGSQDGIYNIRLYPCTTFEPNTSRWPWPTFHRDNARTGCTAALVGAVSASIAGTVTLGGHPVPGARISIRTLSGQQVDVYGRPGKKQPLTTYAVGDSTEGNEVNEGGYCISQLPPNATYRITATDQNGGHSTSFNVTVTTGRALQNIALP